MKQIYIKVILLFFAGLFLSAETQLSAKTIVDRLGRHVALPDDPKRVVSLAPSITEIIFTLGRGDSLKGVTMFSDFPPEAARLPKIGSYVRLDLEKIVALKPDLCFATKDGNPVEIVTRLESLGIPVFAVNPTSLESVMDTFLAIGQVLNVSHKAKEIVGNMRSRVMRVKSLVANRSNTPRVFFQIGLAPVVGVGTRTFIHELIVLAGGKNVAAGPTPYPRFSREQILSLSPDIIIITSMARGTSFEHEKKEWRKWPELPAVRKNRIFLVDSNLFDRPTYRLVGGLELLLNLIHPELVGEQR